jgi:hypothetical protein
MLKPVNLPGAGFLRRRRKPLIIAGVALVALAALLLFEIRARGTPETGPSSSGR